MTRILALASVAALSYLSYYIGTTQTPEPETVNICGAGVLVYVMEADT